MVFYRNLFATLCFAFFAVALVTRAPWAYLGAMLFGALSRTATKKKWPDPPVKGRLRRWFGGKGREEGTPPLCERANPETP